MQDAPAFTSFPLDRAEPTRRDEAALAALWTRPDARVAAFWRLKPLLREEGGAPTPAWLGADKLTAEPADRLFLGLDPAGAPVFAARLDPAAEPDPGLAPGARFVELRDAALAGLGAEDGSLLAAARSALAWHESNGFCPKCGARSAPTHGGWKRICSACGTEHFPRVDPVVIMLIVKDDRVLVGRGPTWPEGRFSCLAGFVEPGETIADAARREAQEETGVVLGEVAYLMSQPWPFPSSLMLGLYAEALTDEITVDHHELAEARWLTLADVEAMLAGAHPTLKAPPPAAVAHHLLRWWVS